MKPDPTMTPAPSLWVDVTTLLHWQRPAVGIIRVEHQFCQWLLQTGQEVRFCRYDKSGKCFYPVTRQEVEAQLQRIDTCQTRSAAAPMPRGRKAHLEHKIKSSLARLPPGLERRLHDFLKRIRPSANALYHKLWVAWQRLKPWLAPRASAPAVPGITLPPGSVYVSMGLDWDYKNMADLYLLKQEQGFKCLFFCYDTIPVKLPQLCVADVSRQFAHYFADLAWAADRILCISDSTRRDLLELMQRLGVPAPDARRVHLGATSSPPPQAPPRFPRPSPPCSNAPISSSSPPSSGARTTKSSTGPIPGWPNKGSTCRSWYSSACPAGASRNSSPTSASTPASRAASCS